MANSKILKKPSAVPDETIINKISLIRGQKVMVDSDLADLYNVSTGNLNKSVKRNLNRFPPDFMFQLTSEEYENLIFQFGISSKETKKWGGRRVMPFAFTENGVAMLSTILNSEIAVEMSIRIIRIFTKLRDLIINNQDILLRLEKLEKAVAGNSYEIEMIFRALKELVSEKSIERSKIGFQLQKKVH